MTTDDAVAPGSASSAATVTATAEGATTCDPPADALARPFDEPWQAQAFALTLLLHELVLFAWTEWAEYLSRAIADAQAQGDPDHGDTYYHHWLDALETLLQAKGLASAAALHALEHAWEDAAERTPHGQTIQLLPQERALARS